MGIFAEGLVGFKVQSKLPYRYFLTEGKNWIVKRLEDAPVIPKDKWEEISKGSSEWGIKPGYLYPVFVDGKIGDPIRIGLLREE